MIGTRQREKNERTKEQCYEEIRATFDTLIFRPTQIHPTNSNYMIKTACPFPIFRTLEHFLHFRQKL